VTRVPPVTFSPSLAKYHHPVLNRFVFKCTADSVGY
jgi:hypothetical protein